MTIISICVIINLTNYTTLKKFPYFLKIVLDKRIKIVYTIKADEKQHTSGCSAAGSAPHLGCGCRRFDSCHSDHTEEIRTLTS